MLITRNLRESSGDSTPAQQGAAPDRLQPTLVPRFGFWRRVSLVVVLLRLLSCVKVGVLWPLMFSCVKSKLAASVVSVGAACPLCSSVWVSGGKRNQQQHNKALHPTAASLVLFAAFRLVSKLVVIGRRRVSLIVVLLRLLGCTVSKYFGR